MIYLVQGRTDTRLPQGTQAAERFEGMEITLDLHRFSLVLCGFKAKATPRCQPARCTAQYGCGCCAVMGLFLISEGAINVPPHSTV